jgi:uncharacterized protein
MDRRSFALMALAGKAPHSYTPVQLQKLLFLLDRGIGQQLGGSGFNFQPYHYGPFDKAVYSTLEGLANEGLAEIVEPPAASRRTYRLSAAGLTCANELLSRLQKEVSGYVVEVGDFVRSQSFAGLVSSIYAAFPEMKVNSVFNSR